MSLNEYVKTVTAAVNAQPGKVTLIGHSMAGIVISQVAEQIPTKINKLIYVSAYLPKNGEDLLTLAKLDTESGPVVRSSLQPTTPQPPSGCDRSGRVRRLSRLHERCAGEIPQGRAGQTAG